MIAANEIRIGNYVSLKCGTHVPIADGGILAISQKRFECSPIPLTTEILEKCGFTLNHVDQLAIVLNSMDRHLELNAEVNGNYFFSINQMGEFGDSSNVTLNYIQHLHQLQNLYFALCGEELNYAP